MLNLTDPDRHGFDTRSRSRAVSPTPLVRLGIRAAFALTSLATVFGQPAANVPAATAVYAGVGEELIAFGLDVERATLTRQSSISLPGFVQEAWALDIGRARASARTPFLYVAWSNGGASY